MLRHRPCAYCGVDDVPRTKGHVFPRSIYPASLPRADRITVPECKRCKAIWEDAEHQFRNILLTIRNPEAVIRDDLFAALVRSFQQPDGARRRRELEGTFVPATSGPRDIEVIYPATDDAFNLILRRIVRGLANKHFSVTVPDHRVRCDVLLYEIPPAFHAEIEWVVISPEFIKYGYHVLADPPPHSFWIFEFYGHIKFYGSITDCVSEPNAA